MLDYDLTGLSTRSFEQLVQALSARVLGPGVVVFGDGPDGGREATFEGRVPFPSVAEQWEGYIVVQAKFRARGDGRLKDGTWAVRQLRKEMSSYKRRRRRRRPEFFIFCTNVMLTAKEGSGSKDRLIAELHDQTIALGIKGFALWDYDAIRVFLDGQPEIRQTYAGWVTTGDVLTQVLASLQFDHSSFATMLHNFIQKEFLADQYANLEQAGYKADDRIPLARVFVDLPVSTERLSGPPNPEIDKDLRGCISEVLEASRDRFSSSCRSEMASIGAALFQSVATDGRMVIVGGPGQGKSTVGQFACQMHRAALINGRPKSRLSKEVKDALAEFLAQTNAENLELPHARRFPLRIVLSEFADALSPKSGPATVSLLSFIADRMTKVTADAVSIKDLRRWFAAYPWLVVLDGLDEVPASGNRDLLLSKLQDFWVDVADADADVFVLATTRPQGYSDDFSPRHYVHRWLAPMSARRALAYAKRFTTVRFAREQARSTKVMRRLQRAAAHDATARLMQSPLQITIMAILVDQGGEPPQERWRLFRQYYDVIYRREVERRIPAAAVLQELQSDIDAIHSGVGLLLQVEAERTGNADAKLTAIQFKSVVEERLRSEGHVGVRAVELTDKIIYAASQRLVFLVGLEAEMVGFEIRSLQEFMAGEAIMDAKDEDVARRLTEIAPLTSWRNVSLFAAGRCFADRQYLRDTVCGIATALNDDLDDRLLRLTLAGSVLAIDILEDGAARQQPKYTRQLARLALRLLDLPMPELHKRLAPLFDESVSDIYEQEVCSRLFSSVAGRRLAAWNVLLPLAASGVDWAIRVFNERWPQDSYEQDDILQRVTDRRVTQVVLSKVMSSAGTLSYWTVSQFAQWATEIPEITDTARRWSRSVSTLSTSDAASILVQLSNSPLHYRIVPIEPSVRIARAVREIATLTPNWRSMSALYDFAISPSAETLAQALRVFAGIAPPDIARLPIYSTAWPLAACIGRPMRNATQLLVLAERAAGGDLGDYTAWQRAEIRWAREGLSHTDFEYMVDDSHWPFDNKIGTVGFAFEAALAQHTSLPRGDLSERDGAEEAIRELPPSRVKADLLQMLLRSCLNETSLDRFRAIASEALAEGDDARIAFLVTYALSRVDPDRLDVKWIDLLDRAGQLTGSRAGLGRVTSAVTRQLSRALAEDPRRTGLMRVLSTTSQELPDREVLIRRINSTQYVDPVDIEAAVLFLVSQVDQADVQQVIGRVHDLLQRDPRSADRVLLVLALARPRRPSLGAIALAVVEASGANAEMTVDPRAVLVATEALQSRRSALDNPERWQSLGFPGDLRKVLR